MSRGKGGRPARVQYTAVGDGDWERTLLRRRFLDALLEAVPEIRETLRADLLPRYRAAADPLEGRPRFGRGVGWGGANWIVREDHRSDPAAGPIQIVLQPLARPEGIPLAEDYPGVDPELIRARLRALGDDLEKWARSFNLGVEWFLESALRTLVRWGPDDSSQRWIYPRVMGHASIRPAAKAFDPNRCNAYTPPRTNLLVIPLVTWDGVTEDRESARRRMEAECARSIEEHLNEIQSYADSTTSEMRPVVTRWAGGADVLNEHLTWLARRLSGPRTAPPTAGDAGIWRGERLQDIADSRGNEKDIQTVTVKLATLIGLELPDGRTAPRRRDYRARRTR